MRLKIFWCLLPLVVPLPGWASVKIASGTELSVRLTSEVSSQQKSGQPVQAVLVVPVFVDGVIAIDSGAVLTGNTADTRAFVAGNGTDAERAAQLRLQFSKMKVEGGKAASLACVVAQVENARETVDASGLIIGIDESQTFGSQIDRGINKLQERYGQFAQILNQVKGAMVKEVDPSIAFKPGVDLTLKLTKDLDWPGSPAKASVAAIEPADKLAALVHEQPLRTSALTPPQPSDLTNMLFIGTAAQIQDAFQKAGWFAADALSEASKMETARAIIENRGYKEAPMSILTIDGRPPDLALQKQNDTFSMRHHIRIWKRPETFLGKPVWVAAGTHDISITFSPQARSFTHGIDPNIDGERSKVVSDMLFTGMVRGVALVERTDLPPNPSNATGDKLITDGKMAVIEF